jgi:hypothetical protein
MHVMGAAGEVVPADAAVVPSGAPEVHVHLGSHAAHPDVDIMTAAAADQEEQNLDDEDRSADHRADQEDEVHDLPSSSLPDSVPESAHRLR